MDRFSGFSPMGQSSILQLTEAMNATDNTLVLGASGKTGRRLVPRLRLRAVPVRPASRSSRIRFDWSDRDTWSAALQDVAAMYLVPPRDPEPVKEFVALAEQRGVRRAVVLSGRGADEWGDSSFGLDMRTAEEAVRASNLDWTILRPNNFAQDFDEDVFRDDVISGHLALPSTVGEPFIDIEDVADVAATVLTEPGKHVGAIYEMSGPRSITFAEAVQMISTASGRPVRYTEVSPAQYRAALIAQGVSEDDADHVAEMFVMMERGVLDAPTDTVPALLGRPARTFEDYVLRAVAAGAWDR
jgi:uncharacterized protein YbjT (DUF2867 family)